MKFPKLKIGNLIPEYPIIQGGMAIRISMAELASAVANEGGIGVIAGTALPVEELKREIKKAKGKTDGILGVNIMFAAREFKELLIGSIEAGIDLIISGAGFSRDMFTIGKQYEVPIVPIVSSLRLAKISEKLGADAIVVEGGDAGGHLGTDKDTIPLINKIKDKINIPVIAAGNIVTPEDVDNMFKLGVEGVQMGTRFLASKEANIADNFKGLCVKAKKEDIVKMMSSVGLPANAIKTRFVELIKNDKAPKPISCNKCLKKCTEKFCIRDALLRGRKGDLNEGIFFTGQGMWKVDEILSVKEIFKRIKNKES
ncbi:MAG: nitronate monooxygenase [Halanaerobiales bacterium]|nr:nitronate monooxygenase [Halanaerobiales bacterium]